MAVWRPWLVYGIGTVALLVLFWLFAYGWGWPPGVDSCVDQGMACYCEQFKLSVAKLKADEAAGIWWKGVQQPVNTYSNLYAIISAGYVACRMWRDRQAGTDRNIIMSARSWYGDLWVFCVLFLGLGSMWFHGSISKWVSWFDGFSMYVFTGFLVFYTLDRGFIRHGVNPDTRRRAFWIGYLLSVLLFTMLGPLGVPSEALIGILVVAYLLIEFIYARPVFWPRDGEGFPWGNFLLWVGALLAFGQAMIFRAKATKPNDPWCTPDSIWQPHAFWHVYAGLMALLLYFYWRDDRGGVGRLD